MKKRIISILLALSMTVSAGAAVLAAPSDIPFEQRTMAVDTVKADKAIEAFESDLKKSNNYDKVFEDYKSLMDLSVEISDIMTLNWAETEKLNNGMNVTSTRDELNKNYNECTEYREKIDELVKSILESKYADEFKKYWGDDKTEKVQNMSGIADMAAKEFNDRYYELLNKNADGKEFASLLKEVIAHNKNDEELDEETKYNEILRVIGFNDGKNSEIAFDSLNEVIRNCIPYREGYELGKHLREDIDYQNMTSKGMRR